MIRPIGSLLRRIVGRIKKMAVWFTAFGAMTIPLAIILRIERDMSSFMLYVLLIMGFISLTAGWIYTWREMVRRQKEMRYFTEMMLATQSTLVGILEELRGGHHGRDTKQ